MIVIKQILWSVLVFLIISFLHTVTISFLHPVGGREVHQIFAYFSGGRLAVAIKVYWEYIITAWVLCFVFVFFRYPAHWIIVTAIASFIAWMNWLGLCYYPYQSQAFHDACTSRAIFIPSLITIGGLISKFLSVLFYRWLGRVRDTY